MLMLILIILLQLVLIMRKMNLVQKSMIYFWRLKTICPNVIVIGRIEKCFSEQFTDFFQPFCGLSEGNEGHFTWNVSARPPMNQPQCFDSIWWQRSPVKLHYYVYFLGKIILESLIICKYMWMCCSALGSMHASVGYAQAPSDAGEIYRWMCCVISGAALVSVIISICKDKGNVEEKSFTLHSCVTTYNETQQKSINILNTDMHFDSRMLSLSLAHTHVND